MATYPLVYRHQDAVLVQWHSHGPLTCFDRWGKVTEVMHLPAPSAVYLVRKDAQAEYRGGYSDGYEAGYDDGWDACDEPGWQRAWRAAWTTPFDQEPE